MNHTLKPYGRGIHSRADQMAEFLAAGVSRGEIMRRMDLTKGAYSGLWNRIKAGLGEQAR